MAHRDFLNISLVSFTRCVTLRIALALIVLCPHALAQEKEYDQVAAKKLEAFHWMLGEWTPDFVQPASGRSIKLSPIRVKLSDDKTQILSEVKQLGRNVTVSEVLYWSPKLKSFVLKSTVQKFNSKFKSEFTTVLRKQANGWTGIADRGYNVDNCHPLLLIRHDESVVLERVFPGRYASEHFRAVVKRVNTQPSSLNPKLEKLQAFLGTWIAERGESIGAKPKYWYYDPPTSLHIDASADGQSIEIRYHVVKEYEGEFYSFRADVIETIDWDESSKQLRLIQEWQDTSRAKGGSSEPQSFTLEAMGENEWSVHSSDGTEQMTISITEGVLTRVGFAENLQATFRGDPTPDLGRKDKVYYERRTTNLHPARN